MFGPWENHYGRTPFEASNKCPICKGKGVEPKIDENQTRQMPCLCRYVGYFEGIEHLRNEATEIIIGMIDGKIPHDDVKARLNGLLGKYVHLMPTPPCLEKQVNKKRPHAGDCSPDELTVVVMMLDRIQKIFGWQ